MAWTYDPSLPTDKDKVRFLVGDTDDRDAVIEDGEIAFLLSEHSNVYSAAAACCRAIAARLRRDLTLNPAAGSVSLDPQVQAEGFMKLATELDARALTSGGGGIFAGGISVAGKRSEELRSDRVAPAFTVNRHHLSMPINDRLSNE